MNLTPAQLEALRRINLAQIHGLHDIARWLLKEYFAQWPEQEKVYVNNHNK